MPQNVQESIEDALKIGRAWDDCRREMMVRETQLRGVGSSLQLAGIIPTHDDAEWILESLEASPLESLRSNRH